jgi:hypothetical protein
VATSGVFLGIALQAAEHGGWWWLVTAACGLLGLFGFAVVGVIAFALIRGDATRSPAS